MTDKQAMTKARKIFGKLARVSKVPPLTPEQEAKKEERRLAGKWTCQHFTHRIGSIAGLEIGFPMFLVEAEGNTWEEAFRNYEAKNKKLGIPA